jgi:trk system potassium uptake protein TrkA
MGGGLTSQFTARMLPESINVKIIEKDEKRCMELADKLPEKRFRIIHGDGRDVALLRDENVQDSQAFVALTPNSETNILSCLTAKRMKVRKTVAMLDNVSFVSMAQSLDIGTLINKQSIAAAYIYIGCSLKQM